MPQRWALRLTIEGDLRFASHLDCVRAIERAAARARVPLRFTQGFNPHPILSLACPKPVGVATADDLLVLTVDEPVDGEDLARNMTRCAPCGMRFSRPILLTTRLAPRPKRIRCELALDADQDAQALAARLARLEAMASWPVERVKPPTRRGRPPKRRTIDLRGLIESIDVDDRPVLCWRARPQSEAWPRVEEVLRLVGLDAPGVLARVVRTGVDYEWHCPQASGVKGKERNG